MKKLTVFIFIFFLLCLSKIVGDEIPYDHHPVKRVVTITNIYSYSNLVIIGYITGFVLRDNYIVYIVKNNEPLYKGYKFNNLELFAIEWSDLVRAGGINKMDFKKISQRKTPAEIIDPHGGVVPNDNPLKSEHYYYRIEGYTKKVLKLKLYRVVLKFSGGIPDEIIEF